jgi:hypothetical protein
MSMTSPPAGTGRGTELGGPDRKYRILVGVLIVFVVVLAALLFFATRDDNETVISATTTTPTTAATTVTTSGATTTVPSTTTTPTTEPTTTTTLAPDDTSSAVWPWSSSGTRYTDPVDAARGFAVDFVGFVDPVVGEFQAGDARSGEVQIRPNATGPVTTVLVRQLSGTDTWWVIGAVTANIQIDEPMAMDSVSSPVHLSGTSTAFEAVVNVSLFADGNRTALAESFVMGGSMGEMGPFAADLAFGSPTASSGALVMYTLSAMDGHVFEASVIRVQFAS